MHKRMPSDGSMERSRCSDSPPRAGTVYAWVPSYERNRSLVARLPNHRQRSANSQTGLGREQSRVEVQAKRAYIDTVGVGIGGVFGLPRGAKVHGTSRHTHSHTPPRTRAKKERFG